MGRTIKTHSKRVSRRKKNRGGEYLAEWRILRSCPDYQSTKTKNSSKKLVCEKRSAVVNESEDCELFQEETYLDHSHNINNSATTSNTPSRADGPVYDDETSHSLCGRRIVDIQFLFKEIQKVSQHGPFDCNFSNMEFESEIRNGLRSGFKFKCKMCGCVEIVWSEDRDSKDKMDVNTGAVAGIMTIGSGFSGLQELLGAMDISCMSNPTYNRYHKAVSEGWQQAALREMQEAAEEECCLAKQRGDVDKDGVPLLTVVADASWAKRSYRTNYSSMSGVVSRH